MPKGQNPPWTSITFLYHVFYKFRFSTDLWPFQIKCIQSLKLLFKCRKTAQKGGFSAKGGPSDRIRTCGILLPNLSGTLFPLAYSGFRRFLICFTYSLTLLSPLFPGAPAPSVVIYVVKNASRPVSGEDSPMPDGKRFSLLCGLYCNSGEGIMQVVSAGWRLRSCGAIDKELAGR